MTGDRRRPVRPGFTDVPPAFLIAFAGMLCYAAFSIVTRYLAAFDDIRALQAHLAARAEEAGAAIIDNENVDAALLRLIELVLDAVEEAT